jgi:hypothetical protein
LSPARKLSGDEVDALLGQQSSVADLLPTSTQQSEHERLMAGFK